jgi:hypothetical protein
VKKFKCVFYDVRQHYLNQSLRVKWSNFYSNLQLFSVNSNEILPRYFYMFYQITKGHGFRYLFSITTYFDAHSLKSIKLILRSLTIPCFPLGNYLTDSFNYWKFLLLVIYTCSSAISFAVMFSLTYT